MPVAVGHHRWHAAVVDAQRLPSHIGFHLIAQYAILPRHISVRTGRG